MKVVIQRVQSAKVTVNNEIVSSIGRGLCILLGIHKNDTAKDVDYMARKVLNIRLFDGQNGQRWKNNVKDEQFDILCVSQFTLYGTLKGNKPDFHQSMAGESALAMYKDFLRVLKEGYREERVHAGHFGEHMEVHIVNDGPVTIILDTKTDKEESDELAVDLPKS